MHDSPLRDEIHNAMKSTMQRNPLRDEIHCTTKSTSRQNPLRGEIVCATRRKVCSAQLQMEMEIINDKLPFETDPWIC
jgi:hypothetical protein